MPNLASKEQALEVKVITGFIAAACGVYLMKLQRIIHQWLILTNESICNAKFILMTWRHNWIFKMPSNQLHLQFQSSLTPFWLEGKSNWIRSDDRVPVHDGTARITCKNADPRL